MTLSPQTVSLAIGCGGVALLLFLILIARVQPFLALLVVSLGVGLAAGINPADLPKLIETGVGATLGHIALIVALGAMIGRLVEVSGGAAQLAGLLVDRVGEKRAAVGLALAGLVVGIPVFFEVGVVMLMPLAEGTARRTGQTLPGLALPMCLVLLIVHALLPPHPGAVAAAGLLQVDLGRLIIWTAPVVVVTAAVAGGFAIVLTRGLVPAMVPSLEGDMPAAVPAGDPPLAATVAGLIILPLVLILGGSLATALLPPGALRAALELFGAPVVALLLDVLLCSYVLGVRRGWPRTTVADVVGSALPAVAIVILITGAGGGFAKVLVTSGVGAALSGTMTATGLPILALAYLLALLFRVAQGPTAVAIIAAAGIVAPAVAAAGFGADRVALVCVALGAGGMFGSHVNDAGFWIVTRLTGLDVGQGLRTWTVLSAVASVVAFGLTAMLWQIA